MRKVHLDNLQKVHDFVRDYVKDEQFDMENYRADGEGDWVDFVSHTNCGTVGCVLGWSPFVLYVTEKDLDYDETISFDKLSENHFNIIDNDDIWSDLFGYDTNFSNRKSNNRLDVLENIQNFINKNRT